MKTKSKIIAGVVAALMAIIYFVALKLNPSPPILNYSRIIDSLKLENNSLRQKIAEEEIKSKTYSRILDSLEGEQQKVIIKYVPIYKKIDTLNADAIVGEFRSVFTSENIN